MPPSVLYEGKVSVFNVGKGNLYLENSTVCLSWYLALIYVKILHILPYVGNSYDSWNLQLAKTTPMPIDQISGQAKWTEFFVYCTVRCTENTESFLNMRLVENQPSSTVCPYHEEIKYT